MFSDDELALIAAIHDDPLVDAPRLAYADWCAGNGLADLAEFIRLQCCEPYFILAHPDNPQVARETYWIKHDDPDRANRAIELLKRLYPSERFPDVLSYFWSEYERGLPVYEEELDDDALDSDPFVFYPSRTPLARFLLYLKTTRLADWLAHPLMRFVDVLRLRNAYDLDREEVIPFTESDIRLLAASPIIDRLKELNLGGQITDGARELAGKLLEPRIPVDYDYC